MTTSANLYVVLLVPVIVVVLVAVVRWIRERDLPTLGDRLRRWGFWAVVGTNLVIMGVISVSMLAESQQYSVATAAGTLLATVGAPLLTWLWLRRGGRGLAIALWLLVGGALALAAAACVAPAYWTDVVNDVYPVGLLTVPVGMAVAVWGRADPVPSGAALLILGVLPLSLASAIAVASGILAMLFAPLPVFAVLGALYLIGHRLEAGPTVHDEWHARPRPPSVAQ